jgi:hypothetical protein
VVDVESMPLWLQITAEGEYSALCTFLETLMSMLW